MFVFRLVAALAALPMAVQAQEVTDVGALAVPDGAAQADARVSPLLLKAKGKINVWVQLQDPSLAARQADAKNSGLPLTRNEQRAWLAELHDKDDALSRVAVSLGGRELGRVSKSHNAVAFSVDASQLANLAAQPGVLAIRPVIDYQVASAPPGNPTAETIPYIGASAVQNSGITGRDVRVAVLDSGIDYTHADLGGPGTAEAYVAAFGTSLTDLRNQTVTATTGFPTSKVVGGYDFVGEAWPNGPLAPDPNPIACGGVDGCDGTHGTHVSDIIAGASADGAHKGVAPGASLYAVKVCSSVSSSCSGVALLQGMDFALDPNGDGDISDAVDVINMSLGSNYGQFEDDLTAASENAVRAGVVVVAAAGNAADHPYIVSSPSIAPGVISAAQTQVPSANFFPLVINSPATIAGTYNDTTTVGWAPVGAGFVNQDVVYTGRSCPGDALLGNPSGKVALALRGTCPVSLKVDALVQAGAAGVLVMMADASEPIAFSYGGGTHLAPTLIILKAYGDKIRNLPSGSTANVTVHDSKPLVKSMAGTSARGPSYSYQTIKPEIGAPGASISAVAGTGTLEAAFGGTSGATPMIAGAAALLLQAIPHATPAEIKARLMNNTETQIATAPNLSGAQLAPASRIGGGELRVDRAVNAQTVAFVPEDETAAISFGAASISGTREFHKQVLVYNASNSRRRYAVSADFRDSSLPGTAAAQLRVPSSVEVGARDIRQIDVSLRIDASKLATWTLNGGSNGGNGPLQTSLELDGHVTINDGTDTVRLPWSILAHKAADVSADEEVDLHHGTGNVRLSNGGVLAGGVDVFAWTGTSKRISRRLLPQPGDNFAVIDLGQVGVRPVTAGGVPAVQFAINTFGKRAHPNYPAEFDIYIDADGDGAPDAVLFNLENGGFGVSGQNVVEAINLNTGAAGIFFFADADLNSSNMIMTAPLSILGLTTTSRFTFSIYAFDNYFTGNLTDAIENMTFSFASPRFVGSGVPATGVPARGRATLTVSEVDGGAAASPSQKGLLLLYRDASHREAQTIAPENEDGN